MLVTLRLSTPSSDTDSNAALHSIWFMYLRAAERDGFLVVSRAFFGSTANLAVEVPVPDMDFLRGEVGAHRVVAISQDPGSRQARVTTFVTVTAEVDDMPVPAPHDSLRLSQIRTYVFQPYQMVIDHRTGRETGELCAVLDGRLEELLVDGEPA